MIRRPTISSLGAVALAGALAPGCVVSVDTHGYTAREEKRFTVSGTPDITLATFDGAVEVRTWDRPEVLVEIEKRGDTKEKADQIEVHAEQTGDRIRVEARGPATTEVVIGFHVSRSARLIATVPRRANLLARSGDGSIAVEHVTGRLELRTDDGSISAYGIGGDVTADSRDGSVKLESVQGRISVRTQDGSVHVGGRIEALRVRSGDGTVSVRAETGSTLASDWEISTDDGGLVLYVPVSLDAELDAETDDGRVRLDRELQQTVEVEAEDAKRERGDRRRLRTRLGAGGRVLRLRTGDGSISVRTS
jgi:hypothetical protein